MEEYTTFAIPFCKVLKHKYGIECCTLNEESFSSKAVDETAKIYESQVFCCFVTQRYEDQLAKEGFSPTKMQFDYAMHRGPDNCKVQPVLTEYSMKNSSKWTGKLGLLSSTLFFQLVPFNMERLEVCADCVAKLVVKK